MSEEQDVDIEREKLKLDQQRHDLERAKFQLEVTKSATDHYRATTERIGKLSEIMKQISDRQDGEKVIVQGSYERTELTKIGFALSGHEEDIFNAAMIEIKRLLSFK